MDATTKKILGILSELSGEQVVVSTDTLDAIGLDSLSRLELTFEIENVFDVGLISIEKVSGRMTAGDLANLVTTME